MCIKDIWIKDLELGSGRAWLMGGKQDSQNYFRIAQIKQFKCWSNGLRWCLGPVGICDAVKINKMVWPKHQTLKKMLLLLLILWIETRTFFLGENLFPLEIVGKIKWMWQRGVRDFSSVMGNDLAYLGKWLFLSKKEPMHLDYRNLVLHWMNMKLWLRGKHIMVLNCISYSLVWYKNRSLGF